MLIFGEREPKSPAEYALHLRDQKLDVGRDVLNFPPYYQHAQLPGGLVEKVRGIGGDSLAFAGGYGSFFIGGASKTSKADFLFLVWDAFDFHRLNIKNGTFKYGSHPEPEYHAKLGKSGLNYYHGKMEIDGTARGMKVVVADMETFLAQSETYGLRPGHMYMAGRFQKAGLVPIVADFGSEGQALIDQAINRFRWGGVQLGLAACHRRFPLQELSEEMINASYRGDCRIEKWKKHKKIYKQNPEGNLQMLEPFVDLLVKEGFIERREEGDYEKQVSFDPREVTCWYILKVKPKFFVANYYKNLQTVGFRAGVWYAAEKVGRTFVDLIFSVGSVFPKVKRSVLKG